MNNYHFYEEEAKGKYSVIFKARKRRKLDFVAIKRIEKSRKKKILNEATMLAELKHPNIIQFYEYLESKNHMWAVTEYCPGGDLLHLIEQDKYLPENVVRAFVVDILRGLQFCHSNGIVMCDLKPASVLINEYGVAKIGDFGSAKSLMDLTHSDRQTRKGTPSYMAPELFISGGIYSFQSDLWSIGCIMYELAQGSPPFISATYHDIAKLATSAAVPKVSEFSSDFNNLLENLLRKEPQNRLFWDKLVEHPWLQYELQMMEMPQQHHFNKYKSSRKKTEQNSQFLRASQDLQTDSYGQRSKCEQADDRRQQFIFENDEGFQEQDEDEGPPNLEARIQLQQMSDETGFRKKREVGDGKGKGTKNQNSEIEDSSAINILLETVSRKNLVSLTEIIDHHSDNAVKPIIGNRDIEVLESLNFNKSSLGFPYIDPETLAEGIINGEMEEELKNILDGMVGDEKYNVMGYFESIIQNSDIANYLFKENFLKFYMKLMKGYKQNALRAKIFEVMGFLIRHATVIEPSVIKLGIINAFVEGASKDKSEKVRRKAMAALGELLFYGATQVDEGVMEWDLSLNLIHSLFKILKNPQEDEIVRIYCCKSIENITAQAKEVGLKFAQIDTLMVLVGCFIETRNEGFRASICCCFHHIIQLNASLREIMLQKVGVKNMTEIIKSEISSKSLQILLWILVSQFIKSKANKISKLYLEDQQLMRVILQKLDRTSPSAVKGRIYLYLYFHFEIHPKRSLILLENNLNAPTLNNNKLFGILEKQSPVSQKQSKYEFQCVQYVMVWLYENYQNLLRLAHEDIKQISSKIGERTSIKRGMGYCAIIWHMANCPSFEELFALDTNIEALLSILNLFDSLPATDSDALRKESSGPKQGTVCHLLDSIKGIYMQTLEKIMSNNSISQKLQEYYASKALPFILGKILKSPHEDIKFNCIKLFLYLVSFYMNEDYLFDSNILTATSSKISQLINAHLFPEIDVLLVQNDICGAVPTMTMKLLAILFQINECFVCRFHQSGKISLILNKGYYRESANVNTLKVVERVIAVEAEKVMAEKAAKKGEADRKGPAKWISTVKTGTELILLHYLKTGQEIYLEYPLSILQRLVQIDGSSWQQEEVEKIWESIVPLQAHEDLLIREKAQSVVEALLDAGRYGSPDKWNVRSKLAAHNYDRYTKLSGRYSNANSGVNR